MSVSEEIDFQLAVLKEMALIHPNAEEMKKVVELLEENIDVFRSWG